MGTALDELFSDNSPPSTSTPPPDPVPAPAEAEIQASSEQEPAAAQSAASEPAAPVDDPPLADTPAESKGADQGDTGTPSSDGPPPSAAGKQSAEQDPKVRAFQTKAQDETRKRQAIEKQHKENIEQSAKRIADLEAQIAALQAPAPPARTAQQPYPTRQPQQAGRPQQPGRRPPPPNPDIDPGAAIRHVQRSFQEALDAERAENQRRFIVSSQVNARQRYTDYDAMETAFADEADKNPNLYAQMNRAEDPAQFAYEMGRRIKALRDIGDDPQAWRAKQEEEIRARIEEEVRAQFQTQSPPSSAAPPRQAAPQRPAPPSPPPSLAGATSAAPRNPGVRYDGPTPLEKLLG